MMDMRLTRRGFVTGMAATAAAAGLGIQGGVALADEAGHAQGTAVYATSTFGQKFSPFFYTTAYDGELVDLVVEPLLASDRGGAIVEHGIEGETRTYNGADYEYFGLGDVEVVQNDDGTVDYNLTMREDITFSDGTPATIDDVIFGIYVECDPTYDGQATLYALPIEGMEEYRSGMESRLNLFLSAGPDNFVEIFDEAAVESGLYTEDQYNAFWDVFGKGGEKFAQEIVDYCIGQGYNEEGDSVAACAANWGFELDDDATAADFFAAIVDAYGYDISDDGMNAESAGTALADFIYEEAGEELAAQLQAGVATGSGAPNIAGIIRTGDYSMTVHMTEFDATAIYNMAFVVAPLHYYGDPAQYDYENNMFGFPKGDLSMPKAKNTAPMGTGAYTFEGYSNGVATLKANEGYYKGAPKIANMLMQESVDSDYVPGIVTGTFDIAMPSISDDTLKAIQSANSNGELAGDTVTTYLVDYRGYGYLGINADLVNVGGDAASEESKALRKGLMTILAVYRDTVINSYYGDRASVIQYPISNTSWAAPMPADEGYRVAYSLDADGNDIYTASMSEEEKYAAALQAAIGYFKAAGYTFDEASGKFTDFTDEYEVMVPGQGTQDHPAYGIIEAAVNALETIGVTLHLNDVGTSEWNNSLESNTAQLWCAAWQASVDPDMTQVYTGQNAHGKGTNSNHYQIDDPELDALIADARSSADSEYRKSVYKECFDIVMDWGVELPLYQRKNCYTVSTKRIDVDTMPADMTPFWVWYAEVERLALA